MGGRREVSILSHRPVTSSDLKQERLCFRESVSTFLQLVVALTKFGRGLQYSGTLPCGHLSDTITSLLRTVPTNGKYFFPNNDYVRQVDHIRGY